MSATEAAYVPRANVDAERAVLGLVLTFRSVADHLVAELSPEDFYRPAHAAIFSAVVELHQSGSHVDPVTAADLLARRESLEIVGGLNALLDLVAEAPASNAASSVAAIVRREAAARKLDAAALEVRSAIADRQDPTEVADALQERLSGLDRGGTLPERYWRSWDSYIAEEHEDVGVPLVEGMCYQHTRIILLASEKLGKSLALRQIAFCVAAGIHPFTFQPIEPVRTLVVDAENDDDELLPTAKVLRELIDRTPGSQAIRPALLSAPYGMDLRSRRDRSSLEEILEDFRPQLLIGGPIYKLLPQSDNTSDPRHAEHLQRIFDDVRRRWGCALMLEHHAPSGRTGQEREIRSIGGQRWAAWPEVTVALHARKNQNGPDSAEVKFPHPPRGKFRWPKRFERGTRPGDWPWEPVMRSKDVEPPPPDSQDEVMF